jgi:biopolymer transport protein ExbD
MAQIQPQPLTGKTKRNGHAALNIDMTPLVDLGFLLITFFVLTTKMVEKRAMDLIMPKEGKPMGLSESKALTAILTKNNKVFVYAGEWQSAINNKWVIESNYDIYRGLGSIIRSRQKGLKEDKDGLMLLIKPMEDASYQNIIDALDEALVNNLQRYAIVAATKEEKEYIEKKL